MTGREGGRFGGNNNLLDAIEEEDIPDIEFEDMDEEEMNNQKKKNESSEERNNENKGNISSILEPD